MGEMVTSIIPFNLLSLSISVLLSDSMELRLDKHDISSSERSYIFFSLFKYKLSHSESNPVILCSVSLVNLNFSIAFKKLSLVSYFRPYF